VEILFFRWGRNGWYISFQQFDKTIRRVANQSKFHSLRAKLEEPICSFHTWPAQQAKRAKKANDKGAPLGNNKIDPPSLSLSFVCNYHQQPARNLDSFFPLLRVCFVSELANTKGMLARRIPKEKQTHAFVFNMYYNNNNKMEHNKREDFHYTRGYVFCFCVYARCVIQQHKCNRPPAVTFWLICFSFVQRRPRSQWY